VCVSQALHENARVAEIAMDESCSLEHARQFIDLWIRLREVHLVSSMEDTISWKLSDNGEYSAASICKAHFIGTTPTNMNRLVWEM
jgi:hypothetical protein